MIEHLTIIGHRGAAGLEPENTIPSFLIALDLGCRALELDVHTLPREPGALAVIHDAKLDRTTNLKGHVKDFSSEALRGAQPSVPLLNDVIEAILDWCATNKVPASEIWLNIELKGLNTAESARALMLEYPDLSYIVSSFNHDELRDFRRLDKASAVAPLFDRWQADCMDIASQLDATGINLSKRIVTKPRVEQIHSAGYQIWAYTVNTRRSAKRMAKLGVDGIFTDRPDRMLSSEL